MNHGAKHTLVHSLMIPSVVRKLMVNKTDYWSNGWQIISFIIREGEGREGGERERETHHSTVHSD